MNAIRTMLRCLQAINTPILTAGRWIGVLAISLMVIAILLQVYYRYVLGNALPWPDEAARFCMLWMTGLMAPTALREGGFVAIDTIDTILPNIVSKLLQIVLLLISLIVLVVAVQIGWKEVTGLGGRFTTASLYVPLSLSFDEWYRVPRSWMMTSLLVGIVLLIMVNIELILSRLAALFDPPETDNDSVPFVRGAE